MNMFKNFKDKNTRSGTTVLYIGIALLIFTFVSACIFLTESLQTVTTQDLVQNFGEALAWLIATSIRVMYLGVMGWIGSLITIRGVNLISNASKTDVGVMQKPQVSQQKPQQQQAKAKPGKEAKPEVKPVEPELVVIPLQEMEQQQDSQKSS
jgi:hypothetical protein